MLSGNLVDDAQLKARKDDPNSQFVSFTVAVNEKRGEKESTTYYEVSAPKTGVFDYLKKGQKVNVVGPLRPELTQSTKDSSKWFMNLYVTAIQLELCGSKKDA